ncbi:hypothetical protein [Roseovarius rhodophyticola]|uniref:DUF1640 domain-containing protein n=1 Tax=Roseovarius rhodophyticola TaxID=3080827 RepID=A0ABZ2TIK9_9RHOB|nr:hypothetical protein [Roseovarius sp. W115]
MPELQIHANITSHMTTTTLDIFDLLVDAGIDAKKAKPLAKEILSRAEAVETLATKSDILALRSDFSDFKADMYRALLVQTGAIVAILAALHAMFG